MSRSFTSLVMITLIFLIEMRHLKLCNISVFPAVNIPANSQYANYDRRLLNHVGGETQGGAIRPNGSVYRSGYGLPISFNGFEGKLLVEKIEQEVGYLRYGGLKMI